MAAPTITVLDTVLNNFRTQIDSGFSTLTGPVQASLAIIIAISVVTMAIMWAVDETNHIWGPLVRKILLVGFWAYIITNWQSLGMAFISAFGRLGIGAGGGPSGLATFLDSPSKVFKIGFDDARSLIDFAAYCLGQTNGWGTPPSFDPITQISYDFKQLVIVLEALIAAVILIFAYGWLAIEVVVTVLEFHIVTLVAFCVLPFGVLQPTRSLAENAIAYVFRAGFKAMVLGIIIGLGATFLSSDLIVEAPGALPTLNTMCGLALSVLVILMLALHAPKYASAVVAGSPSNSAGSLAGTAFGVGAAGALAGRAAIRTVRGAASALGGERGSADAARAASSLGGPSGSSSGAAPGAPRAPGPAPSGGGPASRPPGSGPTAASATSPGATTGAPHGAEATVAELAAVEALAKGDTAGPGPSSTTPASSTATAAAAASSSAPLSTPWYAAPVGSSSLSMLQLAAARRSYASWSLANPELAARHGFEAYVEYAQQRHAESVRDPAPQDEA